MKNNSLLYHPYIKGQFINSRSGSEHTDTSIISECSTELCHAAAPAYAASVTTQNIFLNTEANIHI